MASPKSTSTISPSRSDAVDSILGSTPNWCSRTGNWWVGQICIGGAEKAMSGRPTASAGIGTALLEWIERRAQALENAEVGQTKTDANLGARDLFLARAYEPS